MTTDAARPDDHPWYLDLRPDPDSEVHHSEALAALKTLHAIGASVLAVHADIVPSLADLVAGRAHVGWTILVPGSVDHGTIEAIAATASAGYTAAIAPGHPLPPFVARADASPAE